MCSGVASRNSIRAASFPAGTQTPSLERRLASLPRDSSPCRPLTAPPPALWLWTHPASLRRGLCCLVLELQRSVGTTRWPPRFIFGLCVSHTAPISSSLRHSLVGFFCFFFLLLFFNQFQKKMICVKGVKIEFIYDKLKLWRRIPEEATGS